MTVFQNVINSLGTLLEPMTLLYVVAGAMMGVVLGALPGLGASTLILVLLPISYKMNIVQAMALFISLVVGGMSGGYIGSILLGIPGTNSSISTVWDGYEFTKKGDPARALSVAATCNFIGTVPSIMLAIVACKFIASWAVKLGPWEYAAMCFCAITSIVGLSKKQVSRSLIGVGLAVILASVGTDPVTGQGRLVFGSGYLFKGLPIVNLMLGLFAGKLIMYEYARGEKANASKMIKVNGFKFPGKDLMDNFGNMVRSWFTGLIIGFLPGLGGPVASVLSYSNEKNLSKDPSFGHGHIGGVIAAETANNAAVGGALIPLIALGIPGDSAGVNFISAMNIQGINAGPMLMRSNPDIVYMIFVAGIIAGIIVFIYESLGIKTLPAILKIPYHFLYPVILAMAFIGATMSTGNVYGLLVAIFGCALSVFMDYFGIPTLPFVMGFILSPMLEKNIRRGLNYSVDGWAQFFTRPLSLIFIVIGLLVIIWPAIGPTVKKIFKKQAN